MSRRSIAVGTVAGLLLGCGVAVAAVPDPDPCDKMVKGSVSNVELRNYTDCRIDRLESKVDKLATAPAPTPTPTPTPDPEPDPEPEPVTGCTNPEWIASSSYASWETDGYLVNNNKWSGDAGPQTISACSWSQWSVVSNQPGTGTDDAVKTYPDTQKHVNLPVSSLTTLPSTFDVTVPEGGGTVPAKGKQWNAAYDLWLDNWQTEVMVWTTWTMNWQYWYGVNKGVQATIDGDAYHAYTNGSGIWFIRDDVTNKGDVDLAALLKWAVGKGWLKSSAVLHEVEYGFEVAYTGEPTKFTLNDYTLTLP